VWISAFEENGLNKAAHAAGIVDGADGTNMNGKNCMAQFPPLREDWVLSLHV